MNVAPPTKDVPTREWIDSLRRRFPVESEIDAVLVKKLQRRAGHPYVPEPLDRLVEGVKSLAAAAGESDFEIVEARWLTGGASKLQMAFTLRRPAASESDLRLVLRMEPAASVCETSRLREFELLKAVENALPVPKPYWVDSEGVHLPYPAMVYGFANGVTKPSRTTSNVSGLGTNLGPDLRAPLAKQFIADLATLHRLPVDSPSLAHFEVPDAPTRAAEWALNWWERVWEEDCDEDVPLMRLAAAWMRANLPVCDRHSIIHADFRTGNFLFDEETARITAWLDWELGHIGDRHEDLAWSMSRAFGHTSEDGSQFLISGLMPETEFLHAYEQVSGLTISRRTLHFYQVLSAYKAVVIVLAAGYRNARNGKSHQDALLAWLMGLSAPLLDELGALIEAA